MLTKDHLSFSIVPIMDAVLNPDRTKILSATFLGTGFFISNKRLMTCAHVLAQAKNVPMSTYNGFAKTEEEKRYDNLMNIKYHPYADIAIAQVGDRELEYVPLPVDFASEIFIGSDISNYSYVEGDKGKAMFGLTPRFLKGYITRVSTELDDKRLNYIEISFSALSGMSGSPILDNRARAIGMIYRNFRSQILEDYIEEHELNDEKDNVKETRKTYKVVDFGQAIELAKYKDFIEPFLTE